MTEFLLRTKACSKPCSNPVAGYVADPVASHEFSQSETMCRRSKLTGQRLLQGRLQGLLQAKSLILQGFYRLQADACGRARVHACAPAHERAHRRAQRAARDTRARYITRTSRAKKEGGF